MISIGNNIWRNNKCIANNARGESRGINTPCMDIILELRGTKIRQHIVLTILKHKELECILHLFNVYAPVIYGDKRILWDTLLQFKEENLHQQSIVDGVFNTMLYSYEKRGGNQIQDPFKERMEDLISEWDLLDINPKQGKFTWTNRRGGHSHIASQLDRLLLHNDCLLDGWVISSNIIVNGEFDEKLIYLEISKEEDLGPRPLCFNPIQLQEEGVSELIKKSWFTPFLGSSSYICE